MANTIILKKSSTASAIPSAGSLQPGELAVNLADAKLYTKTTGGTVILVGSAAGGGSGTVTSVSGTGTVSGLTLTGTVTTSGSLTLGGTLAVTPSNFASQTANTILAAPNGAAGVPTFRTIVAADVPTLNQNTTGTASNVTGTVAIANGGTGATTSGAALTALGAYPSANPSGYTSNVGTVTGVTGTAPIVSSGGAAPAISISAATISAAGSMSAADKTKLDGIATGATANTGTVTSVAGTGTVSGLSLSGSVTTSGNLTLGGTLAVTASNFASQTANTFLSAPNGAAGVPTFRAIVAADVPTLNQNTTGSAGSLSTFTNYMVSRGSVAQASVDSAILNGFYNQTNASDSQGLLVFNAGGSLGPLQMTFTYGGLMQFRNQTDSTTFTAWKTVVTGVTGAAPIVSSGGANPAISISAATTSVAGSMSAADKTKLDGVATGATANTGTVTGVTGTAPVVSSGGTAPAISMAAATASVNGYMTSTFAAKLDGIAAGATANTGTVTSVSGTGTVSGLTLTGSVTGAGSLTLGGTLSLTSGNVTTALGFTPVRQGGGTNQGTNVVYIGWLGSQLGLQVDATNFGATWPINVNGSAATVGTITSGQVTTALGFTPYNSSNPSGYTSNTGTVTSVSVTTANGVSGTVATSTTTPAITLTLGAITPTSVVASGDITAFSDRRIKANIETIPGALDRLDHIRGVTYTRTDLEDKERRYAGVIAQELEAVLPEAVRDHSGIKAVDYNATIALLIQAVKELRHEVEMLKK